MKLKTWQIESLKKYNNTVFNINNKPYLIKKECEKLGLVVDIVKRKHILKLSNNHIPATTQFYIVQVIKQI